MERAGSLDPKAEEFYPSFSFALAPPLVPPQFYIQYQQPPPPEAAAGQYVMPGQMVEEEEEVRRGVEVSMVPRGVSVEMVRVAMEEFGGVRAVEMGGVGEEGRAAVHFYDLRSAQAAVVEIREQHVRQQLRLGQQYGVVPGGWGAAATAEQAGVVYWMFGGGIGGRGLIGGQAVWANFTDKELDGPNQGSLCILNAGGQGLSLDAIRQVFESFGGVKDVREVAHGQQQKKVVVVVEFFDTRDAARALSELRDKQVLGMQLMIEFNKPKSSSGQQKRRSGVQQSLPLPPRLLGKTSITNTGQSQRWSQIKGGRGGAADGGESMGLIKRTSITTNSNSGGIRRGKNSNNSSSSSSSSSSFKQQQRWKNHNHGIKSEECMFLFKENVDTKESSSSSSSSPSCRDSRTTVMIKNIPNKYSQKLLLNMLDNHCIHCNEQSGSGGGEEPMSAYDFVYLPIDFK
ncbi:putative RNA recognition motif domain, mei2-like RNA recognition, RNA-binding domain superfamily [Dioscorea sansibarensis]